MEDFEHVESRLKERYAENNVTQYVYLENTALLAQEHECMKLLLSKIESLDISAYSEMEALAADLVSLAKEYIQKYEYPESVVAFIERKINKILQYFSLSEG